MSRDSKKRGRGSRTHGGGTQKNRRGGGNRGGRGDAGRDKHEKFSHPDLGKHGFQRPQKVQKEVATADIGEIDQKVYELVDEGVIEETDDGYEVDADEIGVDKILGGGQVRNSLVVRADDFSDSAVEKIEEAGGEVIETGESEEDEDSEENKN
ncbi:MAG: uL15m family ribosomal protein [Halobacteria archaeon]|nr:uL15m family ribosomal protein [Halobacteria archaeon]